MFKPAEQTSEDDVIIAHQKKDREASGKERSMTAGKIGADIRSTAGMAPATLLKRKYSTEKNLCEVAEKAKRAPRDG